MPVVRVYVPIGRRELDELAEQGTISADQERPRTAHAVTEALEAQAPGLDVEDLEFAAFSEAVKDARSVRNRSTDRRLVAAADADPAWVSPGSGEPVSAVRLVVAVPLSRIASFHVDENDGSSRDGSSEGNPDELLWYDVTELEDVRSLLG
jgi:hypothetical protein